MAKVKWLVGTNTYYILEEEDEEERRGKGGLKIFWFQC
jgi:hypothetical protein